MNKSLWKLIFTVPASIIVYIPIILLIIEYGHIPPVDYSWGRFTIGFCAFWGGIAFFVWSFRILVVEGKGTPSPFNPTKQLVIKGPYYYIRNPMIVAIWSILLGETLYFDSLYLLIWTFVTVIFAMAYVPNFEEPELEKKYGTAYLDYRADVGRWFPRFGVVRPK